MSNVTNNDLVFHGLEMGTCDQVATTGSGNNNVRLFDSINHSLYLKAIHCSL